MNEYLIENIKSHDDIVDLCASVGKGSGDIDRYIEKVTQLIDFYLCFFDLKRNVTNAMIISYLIHYKLYPDSNIAKFNLEGNLSEEISDEDADDNYLQKAAGLLTYCIRVSNKDEEITKGANSIDEYLKNAGYYPKEVIND